MTRERLPRVLLVLQLGVLVTAPLHAQTESGVRVTLKLPASGWVSPELPLQIELGEPLDATRGRIAVFIGTTDWSGLTHAVRTGLEVRPGPVLLPSGTHDLVLFLVSPENEWSEVGRFQVNVLTRDGYEARELSPSIEVSNKGQLAFDQHPDQTGAPRETFQDFALTSGIRARTVKSGRTLEAQVNVVGASFVEERLRFATEAGKAPAVDLAGYLVGFGNQRAKLSIGHVTLTTQRHLVTNLAARGVQAWVRLTPAIDLTVGAANGTSIVGWTNPLGLHDANHQLRSATLGLELRPGHPGDIRANLSFLDGAVLPIAGYTENLVNDAERSRGYAIQFVAHDPAQRFRLDAGFARNRFSNPRDPLLGQSHALAAIRPTTNNAEYVDAAFDILHGARLGSQSQQQATVTAAYRQERVEPLYRTVAMQIRADAMQHTAEVSATVGQIAAQVSYTWLRDNLDDLASVLTTRTRTLAGRAAVPLASLRPSLTASRAQWWPTLSYQIERTHQVGDGLPVNADYDSLSQVPDQMNTTHTAGLEWQGAKWHGGYRFNGSLQDNRQIGRTRADLENLNHAVSVGVSPDARFDAALELAFEGAENREIARTDLTRRIGATGNWRPFGRTMLTATVTTTRIHDRAHSSEHNVTDFSTQLSQTLGWKRPVADPRGVTVFLRCARQTLFVRDTLSSTDDARRSWSINSGVTLRMF